jgi:hypothetical protein
MFGIPKGRSMVVQILKRTVLIFGSFAAIVVMLWASGAAWSQTRGSDQAESVAAWDKIVTVLRHPRCLNCHQLNSPLQGDAPRPHIPRVVRGPDNHGVSAMRCNNCHNEMGNNPTSGTPGAPHLGARAGLDALARIVQRRFVPEAQEPGAQWQAVCSGAR